MVSRTRIVHGRRSLGVPQLLRLPRTQLPHRQRARAVSRRGPGRLDVPRRGPVPDGQYLAHHAQGGSGAGFRRVQGPVHEGHGVGGRVQVVVQGGESGRPRHGAVAGLGAALHRAYAGRAMG